MMEVVDWPAPFTSVQDEWEERIRSGPVVGMVIPGLAGKPVSFRVERIEHNLVVSKPLNPEYYNPPFPVARWRDMMITFARARGEWYDTGEEEPISSAG